MLSLRHRALQLVPPELRQRLVDLKNSLYGGYRQTHYAQFGEDLIVRAYFQSRLHGKPGVFVDVGAHHPERYSNTALLYQLGWHGINIDADPAAIRTFDRKRSRDTSLAIGVGTEECARTFYRFSDSAYNTFSKEQAESLSGKRWLAALAPLQVRVATLAHILEEHLPPGTGIDFLSVDVEGRDLDVLRSNDWAAFVPQVIAIEDYEFSYGPESTSTIYPYLLEKGYRLCARAGITSIFEHVAIAS